MGKVTAIAWTGHTFNPWWGCTKVSPGCDHCYAEGIDKSKGKALDKRTHWGKGAPRLVLSDAYWKEPLRWDRDAAKAGVQRKVFCGSMCDVMDDEAPAGLRERLWELINSTPNLIWQLLTKRPHRYERHLPAEFRHDNAWLGTSAENQHFYNVRWTILARIAEARGLISFVSYEPALGPLSITGFATRPDWIICGGESGHHRRPMEREWADSLLAQCRITGTKFFMKQMSAPTPDAGARIIPVELLVREFPRLRLDEA
jgi:protein gp37